MTQQKKTVLAVSEVPVVLDFLRLVLEADDMHVDTACDVLSALSEVQQHQPDLVLLDVFTPNGGSVALCKKIRADAHTTCIQIILFTIDPNPLVSRRVSDGADGCVRITPNTLAVRSNIRRILNLAEVPYPSVSAESAEEEVLALGGNDHADLGVQAGFTYPTQAGSPRQPKRTAEG